MHLKSSNLYNRKFTWYSRRMIVTIGELAAIRKRHEGQRIAFCSGVFDLTHAGHVLFFEDCKKNADILVVGVSRGASVAKRKETGRPVMNHHLRLKMVDSLKPVDYCILNEPSPPDDPFAGTKQMFQTLQPDIYVVNEDAFDLAAREALVKPYGVKLLVLKRWCPEEFEGVSTTKLIEKIKQS